MRLLHLSAAAVAVGSCFTSAAVIKEAAVCLQSAFEANNYLTFLNDDPIAIYASACGNPLKVCSLYASAREYCSEGEVEAGAEYVNNTCLLYGFIPILPIEQCTGEYDISDAALASMRRVEFGTLDILDEVVLLAPTYFGAFHRTLGILVHESATWVKLY